MANVDKPNSDKTQESKKEKGIPLWVVMMSPIWMCLLLALVIGAMVLFDCSSGK